MKIIKLIPFLLLGINSTFVKNTNCINKNYIVETNKPRIYVPPYAININDNDYNWMDKLLDIKIDETKNLGRLIVEISSSYLPKVDTIGHTILHANNEFITYILNLDNFPDNIKKDIVLWSIKLAQYGDNAGSQMLQMYYDLVDKCL
tara:strand:- start:7 stop:447 length:441 start_codon:yes stop_codon:yes gene_type:complete